MMKRVNTPSVMPNLASSPIDSMNDGQYMRLADAARQKGTTIDRAVMLMLLLNFTLLNRLTLSFHRIMHATNEGKIAVNLLSSERQISTDMSARMLNSMSVSSFSLVSHVFEQGHDAVAEVSLDGDLSVFGTAADPTFHFESAS